MNKIFKKFLLFVLAAKSVCCFGLQSGVITFDTNDGPINLTWEVSPMEYNASTGTYNFTFEGDGYGNYSWGIDPPSGDNDGRGLQFFTSAPPGTYRGTLLNGGQNEVDTFTFQVPYGSPSNHVDIFGEYPPKKDDPEPECEKTCGCDEETGGSGEASVTGLESLYYRSPLGTTDFGRNSIYLLLKSDRGIVKEREDIQIIENLDSPQKIRPEYVPSNYTNESRATNPVSEIKTDSTWTVITDNVGSEGFTIKYHNRDSTGAKITPEYAKTTVTETTTDSVVEVIEEYGSQQWKSVYTYVENANDHVWKLSEYYKFDNGSFVLYRYSERKSEKETRTIDHVLISENDFRKDTLKVFHVTAQGEVDDESKLEKHEETYYYPPVYGADEYYDITTESPILRYVKQGDGKEDLVYKWRYTRLDNEYKLILRVLPNGYWERYNYIRRIWGRDSLMKWGLHRTVSQFIGGDYTEEDDKHRVVEFSYIDDPIYARYSDYSTGTDYEDRIEEKREWVNGYLISQSFTHHAIDHHTMLPFVEVYQADVPIEAKDVAGRNPYSDGKRYRVSETNKYSRTIPGDIFYDEEITDELKSFRGRDGSLVEYEYSIDQASGDRTTTITERDIETVRVTNSAGDLLSETIYEKDILDHSRIIVYDKNQTTGLLETKTITYLDGFTDVYEYNEQCCGSLKFTDRLGKTTETSVDYEVFEGITRRVETETVYFGDPGDSNTDTIETKRYFNTSGLLVGEKRNGTIIQKNSYNIAGKLIESEDALNNVTKYDETYLSENVSVALPIKVFGDSGISEKSALLTQTVTTFSDLNQTVRKAFSDGKLMSYVDASMNGELHEYGIESVWNVYGNVDRLYEEAIYLEPDGLGGSVETTETERKYYDSEGRVFRRKRKFEPLPGESQIRNSTHNISYWKSGDVGSEEDGNGNYISYGYNRGRLTSVSRTGSTGFSDSSVRNIRHTLDLLNKQKVETQTLLVKSATGTETTVTPVENKTSIGVVLNGSDKGREEWRSEFGVETHIRTEILSTGTNLWERKQLVTVKYPDDTKTETTYEYGRITRVEQFDSATTPNSIGLTTYAYDDGRLDTVTVTRESGTAVASYEYNLDGSIHKEISAESAPSESDHQTTEYVYDERGEVERIIHSDQGVTDYTYYPDGRLKTVSGSQTYPVKYGYDYRGRMISMITWREQNSDFDEAHASAAKTEWVYGEYSGLLKKKIMADEKEEEYHYDLAGNLISMNDFNSDDIDFEFSPNNNLDKIDYDSDDVYEYEFKHDSLGRVKEVKIGSTETRQIFYANGKVDYVKYTVGDLTDIIVDYSYDSYGKLDNIKIKNDTTEIYDVDYSYDSETGRMKEATQGAIVAGYSYQDKTNLVDEITFQNNGIERLKRSTPFDDLNRVKSVTSTINEGSSIRSYSLSYNDVNQRTKVTRENGSYWKYEYDNLGQVIAGQKFSSSDNLFPGYDFQYAYDDIGNRLSTDTNGRSSIAYYPNEVNQYDDGATPNPKSREANSGLDIRGEAHEDTKVSVILNPDDPLAYLAANSGSPKRVGEYFHRGVELLDSQGDPLNDDEGLWEKVETFAVGTTEYLNRENGHVFLPEGPELFEYDDKGNLEKDSRWEYTWDHQNRLTKMETRPEFFDHADFPEDPDISNYGLPQVDITFTYDDVGRRTSKTVERHSNFRVGIVSMGTDNKITEEGHPYNNHDLVLFRADGGTIGTGVTEGTIYYVVEASTGDYKISTSRGGSPVNVTTASSGIIKSYNIFYMDDDASGDLIRHIGHGFSDGDSVKFDDSRTGATLSSGVTADTIYYIKNANADDYQISATPGGGAIDLGSDSSGRIEVIKQTKTLFVWDSWNLLAELDSEKNILRSYVWGSDLSGVFQGAGGVGGLLWVNNEIDGEDSSREGTYFASFDFNGNLTLLVDAEGSSDNGGTNRWSFDNNATDSISGNNGTLHATPSYDSDAADVFEGSHSIELVGTSSQYVSIDSYKGILGTGARTVSAWVKTSTAGPIVSWGTDTAGNRITIELVTVSSNKVLQVSVNGGEHKGTTNVGDGNWHHIAVVFPDDGTMDVDETLLYVDGVSESDGSPTDEQINTTSGQDVYIGKDHAGSFFTGHIDDLRIYDFALDIAEHSSRWSFDNNYDDSIGSNHASKNGDPAFDSDTADFVEGTHSIHLDGNDHVSMDGYKGVLGDGARSVSAWVKTSSTGPIMSWGTDSAGARITVELVTSGSGKVLQVSVNGGEHKGTTNVGDDNWHHIAVVFPDDGSLDVNETILYIDGVSESDGSPTSEAIDTTSGQDVFIGKDHAGSYFIGHIDDVRIYDFSLGAGAVQSVRYKKTVDGIAAEYEYGPFGEPIRATGPMADVNPFRFSTKYTDNESQLVYYGYRYYSSDQGRWLSREPLGETASLNLYAFNRNDGINYVDVLGLWTISIRINISIGIFDWSGDLNIDDHLNITTTNSKTFYGVTPGASVTGGVTVTSADTVYDLEGSSFELGVSAGTPGIGPVGEINVVGGLPPGSYGGIDLGVGVGIGLAPVTPQGFLIFTDDEDTTLSKSEYSQPDTKNKYEVKECEPGEEEFDWKLKP